MKLINKITATLKPDTSQSSFMGWKNVDLRIETLRFNDGSIRVTLPDFDPALPHRYFKVEAFCESLDDLMIVAQIKEIVERLSKTPRITSLKILSTPYTRYDRPMFENGIDGFGAKCFTQFVNAMKFDVVDVVDCHSRVTLDLLTMGISHEPQLQLLARTVGEELLNYDLVAPDKGALVKNEHASIVCEKVRNPETGFISGMTIVGSRNESSTKKFMVVDDICEGGRTFMEVANLLEENYPERERELYITHGIFSNNAIEKLCEKYSKIHVYIMKNSLYNSLHEFEQNKLNVKYLINI